MTSIPPPDLTRLTESINNLITAMTGNQAVAREATTAQRTQVRSNSQLGRQFQGLAVGLASLVQLTQQFRAAEEIQKKSLALNTNLSKIYSENSVLLNGIQDSNFALVQELLSFRQEGIGKIDKDILSLSSRMRLTGQNTQTLVTFLGRTSNQLLLNREGSKDLLESIQDSANRHGAKTDELIGSLDKMASKLAGPGALGLNGMLKGFSELEAQLKGAGREVLQQSMDLLLKEGGETFFAKIGALPEMLSAQRAGSSQEFEAAMRSIAEKASKDYASVRAQALGTGGLAPEQQRQRLQRARGTEGTEVFSQLLTALDNRDDTLITGQQEIITFEKVKAIAFKKLENAVVGIYSFFTTGPVGVALLKVAEFAVPAMSIIAWFLPGGPLLKLILGVTGLASVFNMFAEDTLEATEEQTAIAKEQLELTKNKNKADKATTSTNPLLTMLRQSLKQSVEGVKPSDSDLLLSEIRRELMEINGKTKPPTTLPTKSSPMGDR